MKHLSYKKLPFSVYIKLSKEVPVRLVKVVDSEQVGNNVFIIGVINKDGIDYFVGVEKRFLSIKKSYGISHLIVKNRKNKTVIRIVIGLKSGGPMKPKRFGSGGPMKPMRFGSGGPKKPMRFGSGGPMMPMQSGSGGLMKPMQSGSGGLMKPMQSGNGELMKPMQSGNGELMKPMQSGNGGSMKPKRSGKGGL